MSYKVLVNCEKKLAVCTSMLLLALPALGAGPDYRANVAKMDAVLKTKPNDESAHYYRAVSLQYLGEYQKAKADYEWVVTHGRNPAFTQNAQSALKGLMRSLYGTSGTTTSQGQTGGTKTYAPRDNQVHVLGTEHLNIQGPKHE